MISKAIELWEKVPYPVQNIVNKLDSWGSEHSAYVVGGAVRDLFLSKHPNDWDVATNVSSDVIQCMFPEAKAVGKSFGVFLVPTVIGDVEISHYRTDGQYSDQRHPDSVEFVQSIYEDLVRRDFTINALALNLDGLEGSELSLHDIREGIIRCVGDPRERFEEDYLRVFRFFRLCSQLPNFLLDTASKGEALKILYEEDIINKVAIERIRDEFTKIMMSPAPHKSLYYLQSILVKMHPVLQECSYTIQPREFHPNGDSVLSHMIHTVEHQYCFDLALRWASFLHDCGKPKVANFNKEKKRLTFYGHEKNSARIAKEILTILRYPNKMIDEVCVLVEHHMRIPVNGKMSAKSIRKLFRNLGSSKELLEKLKLLRVADIISSGRLDVQEAFVWICDISQKIQDAFIESPKGIDLEISGHDIMRIAGVKEGPKVGEIIKKLEEMIDDDPSLNTREVLVQRLEKYRISGRLV